jgi:hypothetical protein
LICCGIAALSLPAAQAADSLVWRADQDQVDANLTGYTLPKVLRKIAGVTGWKIYYEPGSAADISVKFTNAPENEALRRLLGKLNFAKETTNGVTHLLVFQTVSRAATQAVAVDKIKDYLIRNELLVKLKKNSPISIEELAKQLHAKIVGRDDRLGLYRLQFDDEAAATAAQQALANNDSVAAVAHNYLVDPPTPAESGPMPFGRPDSPASLLNPQTPANGAPVIGLIDTAVQSQAGYDQFMLTPISVVGQPDVPNDQPAHGTAMLETMVQAMSDNPSMIQPVVIYQNGEQTTTFELMQGILASVNAGDNPINLSLGGTGDSDMLHSLIDAAMQRGVVFVAASGNSGGTSLTYPAAYSGVISVTAPASYADNGSWVNTIASGTSYVPFQNLVWEVQGTSTSTANVTADITQMANSQHISLTSAATQWVQQHPAH